MGNQINTKIGSINQSLRYVMVDDNPYSNATAEYLIKLYEPTVVATQLKPINHQLKRCPPKKKSFVLLTYLPKNEPKPRIKIKYITIIVKSMGVPLIITMLQQIVSSKHEQK